MSDLIRMCHQGLTEDLQPRPCPCRYSHKCPDATLDCKFGCKWCFNCYVGEDGKFHHEPAVNAAGIYTPVNTYTPGFRDCTLCMNAIMFAAESGAEVAKTGMEAVIGAMSDVFTLSGTIVSQITNQPILLFCLAASLVPVGIGIFRSLMNVARG